MTPPKQYRALEEAIDAVSASYDRGQPIDNLESAALPNKQRCIEGLTELLPVLYMGFYATRALNRDNRHAIAERMYEPTNFLWSSRSSAR
ncbi:MAG: hypothetical protein R3B99_03930 [Polyangiales bacterium]